MSIENEIKSTVALAPNLKAILNLIYTNNWLKEQQIRLFKEYDLSAEQYNVLRILRGQKGNPANLSTIQERMLNKMSNTTRLIDKLLSKDLVSRHTCPSNRRKIEIYITAKGLDLLKTLDPVTDNANKQITKNLSEAELTQLSNLLDKIRT
ncbi:MarR family transcriptional regulator [Winogradskyella sp. 3972H.M.0a.05]|uniref:MarR family winged helix-turn-helix transcriptional regulator n=1 Tax=Winogradskyella sp. 3972H.M.0a.05 TaxID=2950277 RepID=UPI003394D273